ncbi:hypothetical protein LX16_2432 [Stackebrandtia albiflava]|uniref:Uncharacterized protein n=1 Tax=Stackebrandtia albiflava TaxID=406432 RepID=A0A562V1I4_9ACTN|nr:hypothetical protein [Stackebrandtia albiflava]TWJ11705.1 hypothetical protein LX16_2432 [Stackebrandtia albiflava]
MPRRLTPVVAIVLSLAAGCDSAPSAGDPPTEAASSPVIDVDLTEEERMLVETVAEEGTVSVIVRVTAEDEVAVAAQLERLAADLADYGVTDVDTGSDWFSATVTEDALHFLLQSPDVERVYENSTIPLS